MKHQIFGLMCRDGYLCSFASGLWLFADGLWSLPVLVTKITILLPFILTFCVFIVLNSNYFGFIQIYFKPI